MHGLLLYAAVAILAAMTVAVVMLLLDNRTQRLEQRVQTVITHAEPPRPAEDTRRRSIRVNERRRSAPLRMLGRIVQVPGDLVGVHVLPVPVVISLGIALGIASGFGMRGNAGVPGAVLCGIGSGLMVMRMVFRWELRRYGNKLRAQMPDMIELLSSSVRAGLPVAEAFRSVARESASPTREEFERVMREVALGTPAETALMAVHVRSGVAEYGIFAVTLGVQSRSGGKLAETIQLLAETIRQRLALANRAGALAAEAKLSAYILTALPFVSGVFMTFTQPNYVHTFLHDPRGKHMLVTAAVLLTLGQLTMRKLINGATSE